MAKNELIDKRFDVGEVIKLELFKELNVKQLRLKSTVEIYKTKSDETGAGFVNVDPYLIITAKKFPKTYFTIIIKFSEGIAVSELIVRPESGISRYPFSSWILDKLTVIFENLKKIII